ncbi:MAG: peptide chain release factor-like protein [Verrucomicrobiae bacterium]|nr:peptide chain release factor-like protein [Verrucomicrobiae bacterium]
MNADFPSQIYAAAQQLFPEGTVETQVTLPAVFSAEPAVIDPAVRLVHTPTGIAVACRDFPSQTENYIAAALRLRIACDKHAA